jgi:hypothetical protein
MQKLKLPPKKRPLYTDTGQTARKKMINLSLSTTVKPRNQHPLSKHPGFQSTYEYPTLKYQLKFKTFRQVKDDFNKKETKN